MAGHEAENSRENGGGRGHGIALQMPLLSVKTPAHAAHFPGTTQASQLGPAVEGRQTHCPGLSGAAGSVTSP